LHIHLDYLTLHHLACSYRARVDNLPLQTLGDTDRITTLNVRLLADPVPYGEKYYRSPCSVHRCSYADGSTFSAFGICFVYLPADLVRAANPGGIGQSDSGTCRYSAGLEVAFHGKPGRYRTDEGESFFADGLVGTGESWHKPGDSFRASLRVALMRVLYDWKDAGGFLLALLSANRDYLSPGLAEDFRLTGLSHILALSGMHLSLLGLITIRLGKRIGGKRLSIRLSLFAMLFFVWFAGFSPSLNRALVMALLMQAVGLLGISCGVLPVLALTAIIQMMLSPQDALSIAYMLSYTALWGILVVGESISYMLENAVPRLFASDLAASIGAQIFTAPVVVCFIGVLAPVGIVASCLVSVPSSFYLVSGTALAGISAAIPALSYPCGFILDLMYQTMAATVHFFAQVPPLSIRGLPATITVTMVSAAACAACVTLSSVSRERRSSRDCFARL
jgi:ComEC/Rec2-related protein